MHWKSRGNLHSEWMAGVSNGGGEEKKMGKQVIKGDFSPIWNILAFLQRIYSCIINEPKN